MNECCRQTLCDVAKALNAGAGVIPWYAKLIGVGDFLRQIAADLREMALAPTGPAGDAKGK